MFYIVVAGEDHSDADCFVCAILSHGEEGYVYGTNGRVTIDSIVKNFKGDTSISLAGKPKIFFIQVYTWVSLPTLALFILLSKD